MICDSNELNVMRYIDGEMDDQERNVFEKHLESCEKCKDMIREMSALREVTDTMKIAELPEAVWEKYWTGIYNRIERSVAWFFFILGSLMVAGYSLYRAVTDPSLYSFAGLGAVLLVIGFAVLFFSVLREKLAVNKADRYISEVKR